MLHIGDDIIFVRSGAICLAIGLKVLLGSRVFCVHPCDFCAGVPAGDVGNDRGLWMEMLNKVLTSCDDALWPFAARTACLVALHLQGRLLYVL